MQLRGDESPQKILPVVNDVCEDIIDVINQTPNIGIKYVENQYIIYDMHDGKMLYLITQHSLYNRKYKPFLLCKCSRGDGVQNRDHKCKLLNDHEQEYFYARSQKKWKRKVSSSDGNSYTKKYHMDWVDNDNEGSSHFGISPHLLRISNLRFEVFHLRSAITKRLTTYLRTYILGRYLSKKKQFERLLENSFGIHIMLMFGKLMLVSTPLLEVKEKSLSTIYR